MVIRKRTTPYCSSLLRSLSFSEGNPEKPGLGPVFYFGDNVTDPPIRITIWQSYH